MNKCGFSLIELLFTLSILSIVIVFSFSSLTQIKQKNEKEFLINELSNAVRYAKIQASASGRTLSLLPKDGSDWSEGMDLFAEDLVHRWSWSLVYWKVEWQGLDGAKRIKLSGTIYAMSNGAFILRNIQTQEKVTLYLNRLGRLRQV